MTVRTREYSWYSLQPLRVRMDGMMTEYTVGGSEPSLLEEPVRKLIDTLFKDYSYVLW